MLFDPIAARSAVVTRPRPVCVEPLEGRQLLSASLSRDPVVAAEGEELGTLVPTVFVNLPTAAVSGAKLKGVAGTVTITNADVTDFSGPVTVTLFLSPDATLEEGADPQIATVTKKLKIASAQSKFLKIKIPSFPTVAEDDYVVIGKLTSSTGVGSNATDEAVHIGPPFVDLSGTFTTLAATAKAGKKAKATVTVANGGNVDAKGTVPVTIATSPNADGTGAVTIATVNAKVAIKAGASKAVKLNFTVPAGTAPGPYFVVATLDASNVLPESNETNNTVLSETTLTVS